MITMQNFLLHGDDHVIRDEQGALEYSSLSSCGKYTLHWMTKSTFAAYVS